MIVLFANRWVGEYTLVQGRCCGLLIKIICGGWLVCKLTVAVKVQD